MEGNAIPIYTVDAFTSDAFQGNPAAVCLLDNGNISEQTMQKLASEMNLSETVYLEKIQATDDFRMANRFRIRWFTPTNEVPLCGHATVAAATILFTVLKNSAPEISFESLSGELTTRKEADGGITMNFPLNPPVPQNKEEIGPLLKVLVPEELIQDVQLSLTTKKLLVRLKDTLTRAELENMNLDTVKMEAAEPSGKVKGVIITVKGSKGNGCVDKNGEEYDFISRYFAPWNGIPEDPVTGSAHTVLAPYWSSILKKQQLYARQCSRRGGDVRMDIKENGRVNITGKSVVVLSGKINI